MTYTIGQESSEDARIDRGKSVDGSGVVSNAWDRSGGPTRTLLLKQPRKWRFALRVHRGGRGPLFTGIVLL